jgi:Tol biopolymer transport system component
MTDGLWTAPERSIMWKDPYISPDGNKLVYISRDPIDENDPGGKENYWYMDRTDTGWTDPRPMDMTVNNINIHWQCSIDALGNLYFSEFENNMYVSELKNGKYQEPVNLKVFFKNPTLNGHGPFISPSGDYLIFADKDRLYISYKKENGTWTDRIDLGDEINSGAGNGSPKVSADGKYLFFQSTTGDKRPWGIYWVSTKIIDNLKQEQLHLY